MNLSSLRCAPSNARRQPQSIQNFFLAHACIVETSFVDVSGIRELIRLDAARVRPLQPPTPPNKRAYSRVCVCDFFRCRFKSFVSDTLDLECNSNGVWLR